MRNVNITDRGTALFDRAHENGRSSSEALVSHLRPGEYDQLMDILTRFTYPPSTDPT